MSTRRWSARVRVDDVIYWSAPGNALVPAPSVRLLQAYDEYIVGYRQSKHLLDLGGLVDLEPRVLFPVGPA
ncbi:hypothetical protein [Nonomuraea sp. NPDC003709]|uniref:hypothetical protein n=1 Tax=Nonomuraea sp. NPDC003709 TaxID=3154450 RepID=UPI0033AFC157